jgi:thymidylate synthase
MEIAKQSAMEVWRATLQYIMSEGVEFLDSNGRITKEVQNLKVEIQNPEQDIEEPVNMLRRSEEWVYPSSEEIANIITNKKLSPAYTYSYGPRIFNFNSVINQMDDYMIPLLKFDRKSRRAFVAIWNPIEDSSTFNKLVPGIIGVHFRNIGDKLTATAIVRSNDFFFGWPANSFQLYTLMVYASQKLEVPTGSLTTFSISAHIFQDEYSYIKRVLGI